MTSNWSSREYSQMLCTWVHSLMKFTHLHEVSLSFWWRMNVLMRLSRMNISDSFVKTFSPVHRQIISFLFLFILFVVHLLAAIYLRISEIDEDFSLHLGIEWLITLKYECKFNMIELNDDKIKSSELSNKKKNPLKSVVISFCTINLQ